jgi:two-component system sensor histidine kinase PilS (NtrC family)
MLLRAGIITVLLGATLILNYGVAESFSKPSARFLLVLVGITYLSTVAYAAWYRTGKAILALARTQLVLDLVFWTSLAYATGGIASGFTALFDLWVIVWAVVLGGRAAFQAAAVSTALLCLLTLLMYTGALMPLSDQIQVTLQKSTLLYMLTLNICALAVVAMLVHSLVRRIESTGLGLQAERTRRADLAQLYTDMIRSLTVGIATTDLERTVLTMNPAGLDILGLASEEDIESKLIDELFPDLQPQLNPDNAMRSRGRGVARGKTRRRIPIDYIVAPLSSADGTLQGFIVMFSDLTEMRRLEAALERSRRLAALGELAANLAHEIRNPLGAMSGAFQLISSNSTLGEEDLSLVEIIKREIVRMERLVTDVLDYSRPRKRETDVVSVADLVREVVKAFLLDEEARDRVVNLDVQDGLHSRGDVAQLKQVLWNLLRNALQATEPGDHITVVGRSDETLLTLEVQDTGSGIEETALKEIFEPFYSTKERGLGLGLALCQRIVEDHQGEISAEVRDGVGTVFSIKLPVMS